MDQASLVLECQAKLSRWSLSWVEFEKPDISQVNYLCGQLTPGIFFHRGASLLLGGLMDYYTVPVWTQKLVSEIKLL